MLRFCANCKHVTKHVKSSQNRDGCRCLGCKDKFRKCTTCHNLLEEDIAKAAEAMNLPFFCDYHLAQELEKEIEDIMTREKVNEATALIKVLSDYLNKFSKANELCKRQWRVVADIRKNRSKVIVDTSKCQRKITPEEIERITGAKPDHERPKTHPWVELLATLPK